MAVTGYTRQSTANIQPNLNINAADLNAEFNVLASAFDSTSGHDHSGSVAGDGAKISLTTAISGILPTANGGTGSATITGSGLPVFQTSPTIITPALTGPITIGTGGLTITTGGLIVNAGGAAITGNSTVGGSLTVSAGLIVTGSGVTVTGNSAITGTLTTSSTLTVSAGGAAITGTSVVTGTFNATGGVSDNSNRVYSASNPLGVQIGTVAAPTGTVSATSVMCGLNQSFTPTKSTRLLVFVAGYIANNTAADGVVIDFRYGTGGAPVNGAAVTGTLVGLAVQVGGGTTNAVAAPFCIPVVITGLTLSTAYWIDLSQKILVGGTANVANVTVTITEI